MLQLDLSANFLQEFPSDALRYLERLKFLNISNNLITVRKNFLHSFMKREVYTMMILTLTRRYRTDLSSRISMAISLPNADIVTLGLFN